MSDHQAANALLTAGAPRDQIIDQAADYARIRNAIAYLTETAHTHPNLDDLATAMGLSPAHAQRLFKRWCGLSPKEFVQSITLDRARQMLAGSASVLETAHEVGLSGASRLHDLFVTYEAMTPGDYKRRGAGLTMRYGFHACPFGTALIMQTDRGISGLAFVNEDAGETTTEALHDMTRRWPDAEFIEDQAATQKSVSAIFASDNWSRQRPIRLVLIGSDFDVRVWQALLQIPMGSAVTYGDLAQHLAVPKAARAVGSAVGRNPISFVVPCHRVLRSDGNLGGYHWGLTRKRALIGWETGRIARRTAS